MMNDTELLRRYLDEGSQAAFTELVGMKRGPEGWTYPATAQMVTGLMTTFDHLPPALRQILGSAPVR